MRIMSPPKFIMNISLIMRLIIALIVFQCTTTPGTVWGPTPTAACGASLERVQNVLAHQNGRSFNVNGWRLHLPGGAGNFLVHPKWVGYGKLARGYTTTTRGSTSRRA